MGRLAGSWGGLGSCVVAAALAALALAAPAEARRGPQWRNVHGRRLRREREQLRSTGLQLPPDQYFANQSVDHFDFNNHNVWPQRYWTNATWWDGGAKSPVFLYINGEAQGSAKYIVTGEVADLAQRFHGLMFAIEHRFYGPTLPTADLSTESLGLLSSHQATADIATFIGFAQKQYNIPATAPWVVVGGSYAGALASWTRAKLNNLVFAAIASSGPVEAVVEFVGYHDVIAASLSNPLVGGSPQCLAAVKAAFADLTDAMNNPARTQTVAAQFLACAPLQSDLDKWNFIGTVSGNIDGAVQYCNDYDASYGVLATLNTVDAVCNQFMLNKTYATATAALAALNAAFTAADGESCVDYSWNDMMAQLANTTVDPLAVIGDRQWTYQTCSQFGYYQDCADSACPYGPLLTLDPFLQQCQQLFNISPDQVASQVEFTNLYYGGNSTAFDRVFYVDGSIDPWHYLAVQNQINPNAPAVVIPGTAHCRDLRPAFPSDPPALTQTRTLIANTLGQWLQDA